jgi:hypothetical protein
MIYTPDKKTKLKCGKYAIPISKAQTKAYSERYHSLYDFLFLNRFVSEDSYTIDETMDSLKHFLINNSSESIDELNKNYYLGYLNKKAIPDSGVITDAAFMVITCLTELNEDDVETFLIDGSLAINYYGKLIYVETEVLNFFLEGDVTQPLIANLDTYRIEALAKYEGIVSDVAFNYNHIKWQ